MVGVSTVNADGDVDMDEVTNGLIDELFEATPHRFVPSRDALARHLSETGRHVDAEQVERLGTPPVSVWLVNQWSRRQPALLGRLLKVLDELRDLESALDQDGDKLTQARLQERAIVHAFTALSKDLLVNAEISVSEDTIDRAVQTLRGAAESRAYRAPLEAGRLTIEVIRNDVEDFGDMMPKVGPRPTTGRTDAAEQPKPSATAQTREQTLIVDPPNAQLDRTSVPQTRRREVVALAAQLSQVEDEVSARAKGLAQAERKLESIRVRLDEARQLIKRPRKRNP